MFNIRDGGLMTAQNGVFNFKQHPEQLNREKSLFGYSPPLYKTPWDMSGATTGSQSPNPTTEDQLLRQQQRSKLAAEHKASEAQWQFQTQIERERVRMCLSEKRPSWFNLTTTIYPFTFAEEAREIVKKRWAEQGIWNDNWGYNDIGPWKHEEPLELESESETDTEAESSPPPKRPKSSRERRRIAERRVIREREREASRPYYQFLYQVSKEREGIQEAMNWEGAVDADINTMAYEIVKDTWTGEKMWNSDWGVLPGMSWKHEKPFEEMVRERLGEYSVSAVNRVNDGISAPSFGPFPHAESNHSEASTSQHVKHKVNDGIFGLFQCAESNHCEASTSQQVPSADIDSAGLGNSKHPLSALGNDRVKDGIFAPRISPLFGSIPPVESTSQQAPSADIDSAGIGNSKPISPRPRMTKRFLRPMKGQALWPSRRKKPERDGQPQSVTKAFLGPVRLSKVSKAVKKTKFGRQHRLKVPQEVSSGDMPLFSGVDAAEPQSSPPPPDRVTPRRSPRIQQPVSSVAKDSGKKQPKRKVASNPTRSPAKPQGILKRQPAKNTQGKARKK